MSDKELRDAERDPDAAVRGSNAHERLLRAHERAGNHVHSVIAIGVEKWCHTCPQRWELTGTRGDYRWDPVPQPVAESDD